MNEVLRKGIKKIKHCLLMSNFLISPPILQKSSSPFPVILKIKNPRLTWPPDLRGLVEVSALYPPEAAGRSWRLQELC